jgi:hypothetical protein
MPVGEKAHFTSVMPSGAKRCSRAKSATGVFAATWSSAPRVEAPAVQ